VIKKNFFQKKIGRSDLFSTKWTKYNKNILPLWVADMDYQTIPEITFELLDMIKHGSYGYTNPPQDLRKVISLYVNKVMQTKVPENNLFFLPNLGVGLNAVVRSLSEPNDSVLTFTPSYYPLFDCVKNSKRKLVISKLTRGEKNFFFNFDDIEKKINKDTKIILLCNPHNPTGRLWTYEELMTIENIAKKNNLVVLSDEVHCEILMSEFAKFTSFHTISKWARNNTITLHSASKTYNLASLGFAFGFSHNVKLRNMILDETKGLLNYICPYGFHATKIAFTRGKNWKRYLLLYLQNNLKTLNKAFAKQNLFNYFIPESTYLLWLNCSKIKNPENYFLKKGLGLYNGSLFGSKSYMRLNFACTQNNIKEIIKRLKLQS
jgi:cystathionine beta-lyase